LIAARTLLATLWASRATKVLLVFSMAMLAVVGLGTRVHWIHPSAVGSLRTTLLVPGLAIAAVLVAELPIRDGLAHRTLLYPLLGPVSRPVLALVRTLVTALLLAGGMGLLVVLLGIIAGVPDAGLGRELAAIVLGSLCYVGVFGLLHAVTRYGLVSGLGLALLADYPLCKVPFSIRNLAPATHVGKLAGLDLVDLHGLPLPVPETSLGLSLGVLVVVATLGVALTAMRFSRMNLEELC